MRFQNRRRNGIFAVALVVTAGLFVLTGCSPGAEAEASPTEPPATDSEPQAAAENPTPEPTEEPAVEPTSTIERPRIHHHCEGEGSPTVIIESGLGDSGTLGGWGPVIEGVRDTTRICTYDRVNLGQSAREPGMRTSLDIAHDLHDMLTNEGIEGPYILAGHSMGGFHIRVFADQYPEEVAGMLFIDITHPDSFSATAALLPTPSADEPPDWGAFRNFVENPPITATNPEKFDFETSAEQVRETGPYGDLPLIVLAMDPAYYPFPKELSSYIAQADDMVLSELAALSTYTEGKYWVVAGAGHYIHHDQPQIVINALEVLISAARE